MISYNEAVDLIKNEFAKLQLETEKVKLTDAVGRTLAEDIVADVNLPPFDNSAVDGLAIKYEDGVTEWKITGEISAGNYSGENQYGAALIMTGAIVPPEFNTIIPLEDYDIVDDTAKLNPGAFVKKGMNIRRMGSDIKAGEVAISKGTLLKARHLAAAASCGKAELLVYKKIKFALLATGDELIPVTEIPTNDKIRVSNLYSLAGAVIENGQVTDSHGFIGDDKEAVKKKLEEMLESDADIICTTGGVSVGKYDFVKDIFLELGVEQIFWRAYIKPGKPAFFGKFESVNKIKLVFALPGNPVSSLVNFEVYLKSRIIELYNLPPVEKITAVLENDIRKNDKKRHFVKAFLFKNESGGYVVRSQISQSSGNLVELSQANCLIEIEEEIINPKKGDKVICIKM
ncbi:MAG: molybdopterin molybdotransferase MoeA [Bacteroidetes bacterium]|nr:molybdopterin molybdotransferase MoeA [Bacteroidota bacterium]MBU1679245.1 molybdopterin molybdotransferase MoeA [Bacteroidota bacterium]MBU2506855.1 molybdopterin molybdotransferase MoeA [Bacteroidota bacterium]